MLPVRNKQLQKAEEEEIGMSMWSIGMGKWEINERKVFGDIKVYRC
jgi:hypothetical protein